ncbi:MAG: cation diffusion facilitator family transporter [Gemmatimonadales bacterium]
MATKRVLYAALAGNVLVAATKAVAAFVTGSSAMLSEAVHSFVDSGNQVLLLYGMRRAKRPPHAEHPLGHGREIYFWSFVVALLIFALGAGVSMYEGILHIRHPEPITKPLVNYGVFALAFLFEGWSWRVALVEFKKLKGSRGFIEQFERSKDPPSFMVLLEDSAALLGIIIAAGATFLSVTLQRPALDGVASVLIGLILATVAMALARESKSLLIGEQADPKLQRDIARIADDVSSVHSVEVVLAQHLAPDQIIVALRLRFPDDLPAVQVGEQVKEIERRIQQEHPQVVAVFVRPRE